MILQEARQAVADVRAVEQGEAGRITLGFVSPAAISVLPLLLAFIRAQLPRAEVELKELAPGASKLKRSITTSSISGCSTPNWKTLRLRLPSWRLSA